MPWRCEISIYQLMSSKFDLLAEELSTLILQGSLLYYAMAKSIGRLDKDTEKLLEKRDFKLPLFDSEYDTWYSESLRVVKQIIPDRLDDFVKQYKNDKRKEISFLTYGISDYLLGLKTTRGGEIIADRAGALSKMQLQNSILKAAEKRFTSSLFDMREVLQADIFDSELDAALELGKKVFSEVPVRLQE